MRALHFTALISHPAYYINNLNNERIREYIFKGYKESEEVLERNKGESENQCRESD
jgi:hypothetical protein